MNSKYSIYILAFIACLHSSCSSDVLEDEEIGRGAEMSFAVSGSTRASVATSINEFTVYGDYKNPEIEADAPVVLFDKTKVVYNGADWSYSGIKYWFPSREHSFVAVSPSSVLEAGNAPRYSNSQLSFTYTIPTSGGTLLKNSDVADIMVATHRRLYELPQNSSVVTAGNEVTLIFGHILSLINFAPAFDDNLMSSDAYILIHKLELSGINTKARFDILPEPRQSNGQTDGMVVDVAAQENGNITIGFNAPVKVENNAKNVSLFADNDAIIMLPQTFTANSEAKVTFSYSVNGETKTRQVELPLNNQKWASGRSYFYKFTIEMAGVKFDNCEINPWNEIKGDDIIVD